MSLAFLCCWANTSTGKSCFSVGVLAAEPLGLFLSNFGSSPLDDDDFFTWLRMGVFYNIKISICLSLLTNAACVTYVFIYGRCGRILQCFLLAFDFLFPWEQILHRILVFLCILAHLILQLHCFLFTIHFFKDLYYCLLLIKERYFFGCHDSSRTATRLPTYIDKQTNDNTRYYRNAIDRISWSKYISQHLNCSFKVKTSQWIKNTFVYLF